MAKYVYVVVAYDSWRECEDTRNVCAFLEEEAAKSFEREVSNYAAQFASRMNFSFDSPLDPGAKSQCLGRAPWYEIAEVELRDAPADPGAGYMGERDHWNEENTGC